MSPSASLVSLHLAGEDQIPSPDDLTLDTLIAPQPLTGLPLQVPLSWRLQSVEPASLKTTQADTGLVLDQVPQRARLFFPR